MSLPLVSIVIVSYNHSDFVKECLDSALLQTYTNWELIVADDASKDDSVAVINTWLTENNVQAAKVFHKKNTGVCNVLNECIALCKGVYIKTIAADDIMHPHLIQKAVEELQQKGDEYGICYTNAQVINERSEKLDEYLIDRIRVLPQGWVRDELYFQNFIPALTILIRRSVYKHLGQYDPTIVVEDYEYWLRMAPHYKFAAISEILGYYRSHSTNISRTHNIPDDISLIKIKYDLDGSKVEDINRTIIDRYNYGDITQRLKHAYLNYIGRTKWLTYCLKNNISYNVFRIVNKLLKIN